MFQAQTHPPGSHESEGKTFAWCGWGLPGANNQPNGRVLLICGVYGAACRETETFACSDRDSAGTRLGESASGASHGQVPAAAERVGEGKPGQDQCGDPCLPGTNGKCSYNHVHSMAPDSPPYCPTSHLLPTLHVSSAFTIGIPINSYTQFTVPSCIVRYS